MRHTDVCQCHDYVNHDTRTMTYGISAVTVNQLEQQLLVLAVTGPGSAQEHRGPFSLGYPARTRHKVRIAPVPDHF